MKDILKFFETIMNFKGLSHLVFEQSLIKKQSSVFYFTTVTEEAHGVTNKLKPESIFHSIMQIKTQKKAAKKKEDKPFLEKEKWSGL